MSSFNTKVLTLLREVMQEKGHSPNANVTVVDHISTVTVTMHCADCPAHYSVCYDPTRIEDTAYRGALKLRVMVGGGPARQACAFAKTYEKIKRGTYLHLKMHHQNGAVYEGMIIGRIQDLTHHREDDVPGWMLYVENVKGGFGFKDRLGNTQNQWMFVNPNLSAVEFKIVNKPR